MMFPYTLMPLDQHYDDGLGAMGEAFEEAADRLVEAGKEAELVNAHLPINFLYRHAIELFLKSMIVVIHRALALPYGSEPPEGTPFLPDNGKWKPMHREHRLAVLSGRVVELIHSNETELDKRCKTDWSSFSELCDDIETISRIDPTSTFFRYTDRRKPDADREKSSWKEHEVGEVFAQMGPEGEPVKAFILLDADDTMHAYQYSADAFAELSKLLGETTEALSAAHSGLRVELAGGF